MKGIVRLILLLPILASAAACGRDGPPTVARAERPNVLLVTIDTLRALGAVSGSRPPSRPRLSPVRHTRRF